MHWGVLPRQEGGGTTSQIQKGCIQAPIPDTGGLTTPWVVRLLPARKRIFTARIRRMTEGNVSLCPPVQGGTHPRFRLDGVPPPPAPIRRQISIVNTCYAAGGMPLAFTQEDFLVLLYLHSFIVYVFTFYRKNNWFHILVQSYIA